MAKLQKYHDVTAFCSDKPFASGAPQDHAKYDAKTRTLIACDGKIGIVVPVPGECDAPDGLVTPAKLAAAAEKEYELSAIDGKLAVNKKFVTPNGNADLSKFGNLFSVIDGSEPDVVIPLSLETLGPLVDYTRRHGGDGGIYLCVHHTPGDKWQKRKVDSAIQFFFDVKQEDKNAAPVQVVGALMPCSIENQQGLHDRLRAALVLVNSGKNPKEKAAEARQKAVHRKAAQAEALAENAKKRQAVCKAEEEEDDDKPVAVVSKGKAKPKAGTVDDAIARAKAVEGKGKGKATPKVTTPKAEKPPRNGESIGVADLLTRAQASLSRHKFAAARRCLNTARTEIEAGNGSSELLTQVDKLDLRISKDKAAFKKG